MENIKDNFTKILIFVLIGAIIIVLFVLLLPQKGQRNDDISTPIISVSNRNITLEIGESTNIQFTANVPVNFKSTNQNVAIVDSKGIVTGLSNGNAVINISSDDNKVAAYVNVYVNAKTEPLKVLRVEVDSSNEFKKYVKNEDTLIINVEFNRVLEEKPRVLINDEELMYTFASKKSNVIVEKEVKNETDLTLKVYNGTELLYTYELPKVDNEAPNCTLKEEGEYLKITGTDNYGIGGYAISQNKDYTYSQTTMLKYDKYGMWYGYIVDLAGNEGSCSINLVKPIINIDPTNITIVGDSRMAALCGRDWYKAENGSCVAKSAMGYNWLVSDAIGEVNSLNSSKKKYIVNNLGVNDLRNVDKYVAKYEELAIGSWKNSMIFLLSVNPTEGKYADRNSRINNFNEKMKNLASEYSNMSYCDTNTYLKRNGFSSPDGLHYSKETDKVIYEQIKKCIYDYYN